MEQNGISVALNSDTICFKEEDRIFGILYKLYHEEIDPLIIRYEEALQRDIKAVSNIKLASIKAVLNSNNSIDDLVPFAASLRVLVNEYREKYEYDAPETVIYDIKQAFETIGKSILERVFCTETYGFKDYNLHERFKKFENWYHENVYKNEYLGSDTFEEYVSRYKWDDYDDINEHMYIEYMNSSFWDVFITEMDRFGDLSTAGKDAKKIIEEAQKEIAWRQEYLKNPKYNSLVINLRMLCEKTILEVILCTSQALELNLNLDFCSWDNYQICLKNIESLKTNNISNAKEIVLEVLRCFPFEGSLYKYLYREFGDPNGVITSLAYYFELDVSHFKKEVLAEYINGLSGINMDSEDEIVVRLQEINTKKHFLEYDARTKQEDELNKRLQELDIIRRTVRGKLYETREEAENVKNDYTVLEGLIRNIDLDSHNLLDSEVVSEIKEKLLAADFKSVAFRNNADYILNEINPVLDQKVQMQSWRKQLQESSEPWITVKNIIMNSEILPEYKEKLKYWDFNGLKKYYPTLIQHERPVLFLQTSLFGWSNYFVFTNKRVLHVAKNVQKEFVFDTNIIISYRGGSLCMKNSSSVEELFIPIKYPSDKAGYFMDIVKIIIKTLHSREESLFDVPNDFYPDMSNVPTTQEVVVNQIKDIFQNKVSPFWKNAQKTVGGLRNGLEGASSSQNTGNVKYCTQCGTSAKKADRFCSKCGTKLC